MSSLVLGVGGPDPARAAGALSNLTWTVSPAPAHTGDTNVTYTFSFDLGTNWKNSDNVTTITVTLPAGTTGTSLTGSATGIALSGSPTYNATSNVLTFPVNGKNVGPGTLTLVAVGLHNTATAGSYTSTLTAHGDSVTSNAVTFTAATATIGTLTNTYWIQSSAAPSATGVTGRFGFTTGTAGSLSAVRILLPTGFSGTPGTPTVTGLPAGTLTSDATSLTYTFASTSVPAGTVVLIAVPGLHNPASTGTSQATFTTYQDAAATSPVDSGTSNKVAVAPTPLTVLTWSASPPATGASASYDIGFSVGTHTNIGSVTVTLPPGTTGTPTLTSITGDTNVHAAFTNTQVARSGTTLTITFDGVDMGVGAVVEVVVGGLTNLATAGDYATQVTTYGSGLGGAALGAVVDSGISQATSFTGATLTDMTWAASSLAVGQANVTYTYGFGVSASVAVASVSMSLPPGTGNAAGVTVGPVTPASFAGGSVSVTNGVATYTFPQTVTINPNVAVSIALAGITNTSTPASYTSQVVAKGPGGQAVAATTSPSVTFAADTLLNPTWAPSSNATGAASTYTYGFTTAVQDTVTSITFTVPTQTTGTPHVDASGVSIHNAFGAVTMTSPNIVLTGTTLTLTWASLGSSNFVQENTSFTIVVTGLINTTASGSYTSAISTFNGTTPLASASTPATSMSAVTVGTPVWTTTDATVSRLNPTYTYSFTLSQAATIASITVTLPPDTPAGTPTLGTVSPASFQGGTLTRSGNVLTYAFTPQTLDADVGMSIPMVVAQNTPDAGTYTSPITVFDAGSAVVASGTTTSVTFTSQATTLTNVTWTQSTTMTGVSQVHYTWTFTTASQARLSYVTMTVPAGTGGSPQIVSLTTSPSVTLATPAVTLSGTVVTLSFGEVDVGPGRTFTLEVSGMVNTSVAGGYSSSVTTTYGGSPRDSGVSPVAHLVAPPSTTMTWTPSRKVAQAPSVSYTYAFTTVSAPTLTSIVLTVPPGTSPQSSAPTLTSFTLAGVAVTGATVTASQTLNTLTVSFPSRSIATGTAVSIVVDGLHNSGFVGSFVSKGKLVNSTGTVGTMTASPVAIEAQKTVVTTHCVAGTGCATDPSGSTLLTLVAIPGAAPVLGGVELSVQSNASFGYVLRALSSGLVRVGGTEVLPFAPGTSSLMPNQFGVTAAITPATGSGAALCPTYATSGVVAGYATAASAPIWAATSGTGTGSDTVTLSNLVQVSFTQRPGTYSGTINYSLLPGYTSGSGC